MRQYFFLTLIIILAAILRFWNLTSNPPGLTWDEASFGYNAYSILKTGRDEYGNLLPVNLKSFGDYKPALYSYIDIPFVATLGLNELSVRLPSVIFGILGILGAFLLTKRLFNNKWLALSVAFFLAISPWHIHFSRPAFEANLALTFNIFGTYFFLHSSSKKFTFLAMLAFGLSILTYQASRLFVPLIILTIFFSFRKQISFKKLAIPGAIMVAFIILVGASLIAGQISRLTNQNYFAYQRSEAELKVISSEDGMESGSLGFRILHGQWWSYIKGLVERYAIYFSPKMLFIDGDYNQRHRVPDLGALYFFDILLIPLGLIYFLKSGGHSARLLFLWLLLSPIPAVLSRDLISTLRALNMILPLVILEAGGFYWLVGKIKGAKSYLKYFLAIIIFFGIVANFLIYLDRYFIHAPKEYSKYWLYGYKELFTNLPELKKYNHVLISDKYGQPYIYYLFYTKYPPADFQKQAVLEQPTVDVGTVRKIDNIEFRNINISGDITNRNTLIVDTFDEIPPNLERNVNILRKIKFLNDFDAYRIMETK